MSFDPSIDEPMPISKDFYDIYNKKNYVPHKSLAVKEEHNIDLGEIVSPLSTI